MRYGKRTFKIVAERTRKETAKEILQYLYDVQMFGKRGEMVRAIEQIAKQYGVEVG